LHDHAVSEKGCYPEGALSGIGVQGIQKKENDEEDGAHGRS
jgi:hypothetical protein